jgi:hypothetical protein
MMNNLLVILVSFLLTQTLRASDSLGKIYTLSEDVRDIVLEAPGGHPMPNREFHLTTMQSDQVKALASLDNSMRIHLEVMENKKDCDKFLSFGKSLTLEKKVADRDFKIQVAIISSDKRFEQNILQGFNENEYENFLDRVYKSGKFKARGIMNLSSLRGTYKSIHRGNDLDNQSLIEKERILREFTEVYLGETLPPGLLMKELVYDEIIGHSTDWKKTLSEVKDVLSSEQKLELVSRVGGSFSERYDKDRAEAGLDAMGSFVNTQQLLDSVKNEVPGGICRDISLAQAQMLKALGFSNTYVIGYKTAGSAHATVITTDPATGKIYKFNYSQLAESKKGSGTEVLFQDSSIPSRGLGYRVYDTDGKPVTFVASDLSKMMREVTAADTAHDFDPRNFNLSTVKINGANFNGSLYTGRTSAGENVYGVSVYKNEKINEFATVGGGASAVKLEGTSAYYKVDQTSLYLRTNTTLKSPAVELNPMTSNAFLSLSGEFLISGTKEKNLSNDKTTYGDGQVDGNGQARLGVQNNFTSNDQKTTVKSEIYTNFYPEIDHIAEINGITAVQESVVIGTGVSHALTHDSKAFIDTAIIMREYGTSMVVNALYTNQENSITYSAGFAAPVSRIFLGDSDMPSFLPGGETRVFGGISQSTDEYFTYTLMYERNFNDNSQNMLLRGEVKF